MTYVVPLFATMRPERMLAEKAGAEFRDSVRSRLVDSTLHVEFQPKGAFYIQECQQQRYCEVIWLEESFDTPNLQTVSLSFRSPDPTFSYPTHPSFTRNYRYYAASERALGTNRREAIAAFAECVRIHHRDVHLNAGTDASKC